MPLPRRVVPLLALLVPLVLAGVWFLLEHGQPREPLGAPSLRFDGPTADASGAATDEGFALAPAREAGRASERAAARDPESGGGLAAPERWTSRVPRDAKWLRGRVQFPGDTPPDEELWVVAEGARFFEGEDSPRRHRAKVEADGTFAVAVAAGTHSKGKLTLRGRYLYLAEPYYAPLDAPDDVVLEPLVGGAIEVTVLPPRSVAFERGVLDGVSVRVPGRAFRPDDDRDADQLAEERFLLGGLPSSATYTVEADSPRFAPGRAADVSVQVGAVKRIDLALVLGVHLEGTVVDPTGAAVREADVAVVPAERMNQGGMAVLGAGMAMARDKVRTGPGGRFEFVGLPPGDALLMVQREGYLPFTLDLGELVDGVARDGLVAHLERGRVVSGVVRWPDGTPAEGAEVRIAQRKTLFESFETPQVVGDTVTGPDGTFEFGGLIEGECDVAATAVRPEDRPTSDSLLARMRAKRAKRWTAREAGVEPGSLGLELLLQGGAALSGRVVDDAGEPLAAFSVAAYPRSEGFLAESSVRPVRERFDEAAGEFDLGGLAEGVWEVAVSAAGYADSPRRRVEVPTRKEERFVLPRAATLAGIVRDPAGEPLSRGKVTVRHGDNKKIEADADADGAFRAGEVTPGPVTLQATADGFASSDPLSLDVKAGQQRTGIALALREGAVIAGYVHGDQEVRTGRTISLQGPTYKNASSDSDARFRFEGLEPGEYKVVLEPEGGRRRGDQDAWILSLSERDQVDVTVTAGEQANVILGAPSPTAVTVRGRILQAGETVAGGTVMVMAREDSEMVAAARADDSGHYELELDAPGTWRFRVAREGFNGGTELAVDVPGPGEATVDLVLPEARIVGRVTRPDGTPLEDAPVTLAAAGSETEDGAAAWFGTRRETTDADGQYTFRDLAPGDYVVRAGGTEGWGLRERGADFARVVTKATVDAEEQEVRVDVRLAHAGTLSGEVRSVAGDPVSNARIQVLDESGIPLALFSNVRSQSDGSFTVEAVVGSLRVVARSDGTESETREVRVPEGGDAHVVLTLGG